MALLNYCVDNSTIFVKEYVIDQNICLRPILFSCQNWYPQALNISS